MRSCFFTGQNMKWISADVNKKLKTELQTLIDNGFTEFYGGCESDWDILCINHLLSIRMNEPEKNIKLHLVLPCPPELFTEGWSKERKDDLCEIQIAADSVEILSPSRVRGYRQKRNARLAGSGEVCLCYFDEERVYSIPAQTVRMARGRGVLVINHFG